MIILYKQVATSENTELKEVILDFTSLIKNSNTTEIDNGTKCGQLWVGFCNPEKEVYKFETALSKKERSRMNPFRRLILLRELLLSEYPTDYMIIDTSPGIRYWSIIALVVADVLLLTLKMGDLDIVGTKALIAEIYRSFTKYGSKSFILWNRVAGYCIPHVQYSTSSTMTASLLREKQQAIEVDARNFLTRETGMEVISSIPCYCDIQFSRKEFLTVLDQPMHPFSKQFERLVQAVKII